MVRSLSADCRRLVLLALVSVGCLLSSRHIFAADADSAGTTPSGAVFFAEVAGLDSWIDKLRHSPLVASLAVNPQVQAFYASPQGRKALAGRVLIEGQVGMDLWTLAKAALGGRVSVALYPHDFIEADAVRREIGDRLCRIPLELKWHAPSHSELHAASA